MSPFLLALLGIAIPAQIAPPTSPPTEPPESPDPLAPATASAPQSDRAESGSDAAPSPATFEVDRERVIAVRPEGRTPLATIGRALGVHQDGPTLYVARGRAGVAVYDVSDPLAPKLLRTLSVGTGSATGFHVANGELWVLTVSRTAVPIDETAEAPPLAASPGDSRPPENTAVREKPEPEEWVSLKRISPGTVELGVGTVDGVRVGDRYAVFRKELVHREGATGFEGEELVTIAEVVAVKEGSALAEIGRGAIVKDTDRAKTAEPNQTSRWIYPPKMPHVGEVSLALRPLINAGSPIGLGVIADIEASYWGRHYFVDARVQPLGLGWTDEGSVVSTAALLEAGYDGRALAVGLGGGVSWVNGDLDYMLDNGFGRSSFDAEKGEGREERQETHAAFTVSQVVRLGARDGLNVQLYNLLLLHDDSSGEDAGFIYGGTTARLLIPVAGRTDLLFDGGGGIMGYWYFGAGIATWLVGSGAPGSWKLSVAAGAAGIRGSREITETFDGAETTYTENVDIAGPMVSVGIARRF